MINVRTSHGTIKSLTPVFSSTYQVKIKGTVEVALGKVPITLMCLSRKHFCRSGTR